MIYLTVHLYTRERLSLNVGKATVLDTRYVLVWTLLTFLLTLHSVLVNSLRIVVTSIREQKTILKGVGCGG